MPPSPFPRIVKRYSVYEMNRTKIVFYYNFDKNSWIFFSSRCASTSTMKEL